jgi:nicotinamide mononucleotide transporter
MGRGGSSSDVNWIEAVAVSFGIACVALTVRQSLWCWPAGLVQVTLYVYIFYQARLYSDVLLHGIYVGLQVYGWHHWMGGGVRREEPLPVTRLTGSQMGLLALGVAGGAFAWGEIMDRYTDAAAAHLDAFIAVASLCAQVLLARKKLENWLLWILIDLVAIGVYWSRDLRLTAGLYTVFLVLCMAGLVSWHRSFARAGAADPALAGSRA